LNDLLRQLPELLGAHARLSLGVLSAAVALSVPLGVVAHRKPRLGRVLTAAASVVQTIPGLALLAIMVPLLAALALPSIGVLPAMLGLTLYGILPVLQNTITGLAGVEPALVEAARGVGMTSRQRLLRVELPLAAPVIVAGVRTAAVWIVGMATLSTPIGAPSLGNYIFSGLQTRRFEAVLLGCVASAVLALSVDGLIRAMERGASRRERRWVLGGACGLVAVALASFVPLFGGAATTVRVGAKTFTEQYVLAGILTREMEAAGEDPELVSSLGSTVVFDALAAGELDVYVEYSGTVWATLMERETRGTDRAEVLAEVERWLEREHGVELLATLGFENTYALAVREGEIESVVALAARAPQLTIGGDYEFFSRSEWSALREGYGLRFEEERAMDPALMYDALQRGDVDVISAYSTDGRIAAYDLVVLEDPRGVIPPYDAVILARAGFSEDHPAAASRLRALSGSITPEAMREMNLAVDRDGEAPADVAARFLEGSR